MSVWARNREEGKLASRIQLLRAGQRWRGGTPLLIGQPAATDC